MECIRRWGRSPAEAETPLAREICGNPIVLAVRRRSLKQTLGRWLRRSIVLTYEILVRGASPPLFLPDGGRPSAVGVAGMPPSASTTSVCTPGGQNLSLGAGLGKEDDDPSLPIAFIVGLRT